LTLPSPLNFDQTYVFVPSDFTTNISKAPLYFVATESYFSPGHLANTPYLTTLSHDFPPHAPQY